MTKKKAGMKDPAVSIKRNEKTMKKSRLQDGGGHINGKANTKKTG